MTEIQERCASVAHLVAELRSRIRLVSRNASVAEIARTTGFKGETVRRYLSCTTPSLPFIMKVCEVWELNANWLIFGIGPRYALDLDELPEHGPQADAFIVENIARLLQQTGRQGVRTPHRYVAAAGSSGLARARAARHPG
jgi:DNA-binding phage protein